MQERITAVRASIADIINGNFRDDNGAHVISPYGVELRRVVLIGFVISKFQKNVDNDGKRFESITLDDGSETIRIKVWGEEDAVLLDGVKENILALVVGKVRKFEDEVYIIPEIVREIKDPNFMSLHLMERYQAILKLSGVTMPVVAESDQQTITQSTSSSKASTVTGLSKKILNYIELNANPEGVHIKDIVAFFEPKGHESTEIQLKVFDLIGDGFIREIDPARYLPADM
jgi:RPA family protein